MKTNHVGSLSVFLILALICVFLSCSNDDDGSPTTPNNGTIDSTGGTTLWIDTIQALSGSQVKVDVNVVTGFAMRGMTLPLSFSGISFYIDSVSFVGTIFDGDPLVDTIRIDSTAKTVDILKAYSTDHFIEPDSGVLASIYVTLFDLAPPQTIEIDTITIEAENGSISRMLFTDTTSVPYPRTIIPVFRPGVIEVSI